MSEEALQDDLGLLRAGCLELGVALSPEAEGKLLRFVDLIYVWNRAAGLTTIPRDNAVRLHVLDSLAALGAIDQQPCLDLGTGAGLPGLVLAMASPATSFVLVESNRRRCSFLLEAVRVLALGNVRVVESSVEALPQDIRYPLVISRAFRPPAEFLDIAAGLVESGGKIVLLLAEPTEDDLAGLAGSVGMPVETVSRLQLPGGGEPRAIVSFRAP